MVIWHLNQIGKVKKLDKWVLHQLTVNLKYDRFEVSSSLTVSNNNKPFLRLWLLTKCRFFIKTGGDWFSSSVKKKCQSTSQSQTYTKNVMVAVWLSAADLIHYSFLNPTETIISEKYAHQIYEIHWKLPCLQPALLNRKGPILLHDSTWPHVHSTTKASKIEQIGLRCFASSAIFTWLPTNQHLFKHLDNVLQGKCFHSQPVCVLSRSVMSDSLWPYEL